MKLQPALVRWSGVLWVALFLFWLPFEDTSVASSQWLALFGALWFFVRWLAGRRGVSVRIWIVRGAALGAAIPLLVIALVAFKSGLHAHGFSDVSVLQLQHVVLGWGWWIVGGSLMGWLGWLVTKELPGA